MSNTFARLGLVFFIVFILITSLFGIVETQGEPDYNGFSIKPLQTGGFGLNFEQNQFFFLLHPSELEGLDVPTLPASGIYFVYLDPTLDPQFRDLVRYQFDMLRYADKYISFVEVPCSGETSQGSVTAPSINFMHANETLVEIVGSCLTIAGPEAVLVHYSEYIAYSQLGVIS